MNYPEYFNEIGDSCNSKGYLGFIYADGNGMGKMLQRILENDPDNDQKLTEYSYAIDSATTQGIVQAVIKHIPQPVSVESASRGIVAIFPVEFLIAGGDDLVVVVPATKALQIALDFTRNFERIFGNMFGQKNNNLNATISCGVAIAKATYPINLLFKLARELLRSAKKLSKEPLLQNKNAQLNSAIDFSVVTTSATGDIRTIRKSELEYSSDGQLYLTERPYHPDRLDEIINFVIECKRNEFPKNKLKVLQQSLFRGKQQATLDYVRFINRIKHVELKKLFWDETHKPQYEVFPWIKVEGGFNKYTTPFFDFVEIYEFIMNDI